MRKLSLRSIFKECNQPHQLVGLDMLEEQIDPELLSVDAEWLVCFLAAPEKKEYNVGKTVGE